MVWLHQPGETEPGIHAWEVVDDRLVVGGREPGRSSDGLVEVEQGGGVHRPGLVLHGNLEEAAGRASVGPPAADKQRVAHRGVVSQRRAGAYLDAMVRSPAGQASALVPFTVHSGSRDGL